MTKEKFISGLKSNAVSLLSLLFMVVLLLTQGGDTIPPVIGSKGAIRVNNLQVETDCTMYHPPVVAENGDLLFVCASVGSPTPPPPPPATFTPPPTNTPISTVTSIPPLTPRPTRTPIGGPTATSLPPTPTVMPTHTVPPGPTVPIPPTVTPGGQPIEPFASALLCANHNTTAWHGLWNYQLGCHYDHDHAKSPGDQWVADLWGDYKQWTSGQEVSYPYQTFSAMGEENIVKHNGYAFDSLDIRTEYPCTPQFNNRYGINAFFVESHNLATAMEYAGRVHSFFTMASICDTVDPNYEGTLAVGGHSDFGQLVSPYQGVVVPKPNTPLPSYPSPKPPYFSINCLGQDPCRPELRFLNGNTTWSSIDQSGGVSGIIGHHLGFGFRQQDTYTYLPQSETTSPDPQFELFCQDGNGNYDPVGCWFNGSTFQVFSMAFKPNPLWDGLAGFDEDGADNGFITHHGFGDLQGNPQPECTAYNTACTPLILENVPAVQASVNLFTVDPDRFQPFILPEYDICFLANGTHVECTVGGAIPSGWIGPEN